VTIRVAEGAFVIFITHHPERGERGERGERESKRENEQTAKSEGYK